MHVTLDVLTSVIRISLKAKDSSAIFNFRAMFVAVLTINEKVKRVARVHALRLYL